MHVNVAATAFRPSPDAAECNGRASRDMDDEVKFHTQRAMAEIDLAARSHDSAAAQAHLGLSELHLRRMRELSRGARSLQVQE